MRAHGGLVIHHPLRGDRGKGLLRLVEQVDDGAAQQQHRRGNAADDHRVEADRAEWHVAGAVALQVVAFVFVPVVVFETVVVEFAIGGDVEGIAGEVVPAIGVVRAAALDLDGPAVFGEAVVLDLHAVGAVERDGDRVALEGVAGDAAVGHVLEHETVGGAAPVVDEVVGTHFHIAGVHHGHARAVALEAVVAIGAVVGKHVVQPVAQVVLAPCCVR